VNLAEISAEVRPRTHWEAIDLGVRLVRREYSTIVLSLCSIVLPMFLVLQLLPVGSGWLPLMVIWWCKPLWERAVLHVLSRSLFGERLGWRQVVREFRTYGFVQWFLSITVRRFVVTRSLDLPVVQLEGLSGAARTRRLALIRRGDAGSGAFWLLVLLAHLESMMPIAIMLLAEAFVPATANWSVFDGLFDATTQPGVLQSALLNLFVVGIEILVAPFYVGCGFSLYINRRALLEGWDLEIDFLRLAARHESGWKIAGGVVTRTASGVLLLAIVATGLAGVAPQLVRADEPNVSVEDSIADPDREAKDVASVRIHKILEGDDYHDRSVIRAPQFVFDWNLEDDEPPDPESFAWLTALMETIASALAFTSELFVALLTGGLIAWCVFRYRDELARFMGRRPLRPSTAHLPAKLAGMDVREESLPEDVVAMVLSLWREGKGREAIALLYRATLFELMRLHDVHFAPGFTERDCLNATRDSVAPACASYFETLTRQWQQIAYAHRPPAFAQLEHLCEDWPRHFGRARSIAEREAGGRDGSP
jgi:hypothetical protein